MAPTQASGAQILNHSILAIDQEQMPTNTLKGNNTGGASDELNLTIAQVQTLLGIGGGSLSGSGAANQMAYWTSASVLAGNANLTLDTSLPRMVLGGALDSSITASGFYVRGQTADSIIPKIVVVGYGSGANPLMTGRRAAGTAASPTATPTGYILLEVDAMGYDNTPGWTNFTAGIQMNSTEAFTTTGHGTNMVFMVTAIGATTYAPVMTLSSTGLSLPAHAISVTTPGASAGEIALTLYNPSAAAYSTVKQRFQSQATTAAYAEIWMQAQSAGPGGNLIFLLNDAAGTLTNRGNMDYLGALNWAGGINVGVATGATAGQVATSGNVTTSAASAGVILAHNVYNTDNTNAASHARLQVYTGGASGGDPYLALTVAGVTDWTIGIDNSDSDKLKFGPSNVVGTSTSLSIDTAGDAVFANDVTVTGALVVGNGTIRSPGFVTIVGSAVTGATWARTFTLAGGAHTGLTSESIDIQLDLTATVQYVKASIPASTRAIYIQPRTYASDTGAPNGVLADAAMLVIQSGPIAGPNMTITRAMALWVQAGWSRLGGGLTVGTSTTQPATGAIQASGTITATGSIIADGGVDATGTVTATGAITSNDSLAADYTTASTNSTASLLNLTVRSTGTPIAGLGVLMGVNIESSTGVVTRQAMTDETFWVTPTEGSTAARRVIKVFTHTTGNEVMRMESVASVARIGFLGAASVIRQTLAAATATTAATTTTPFGYTTLAQANAIPVQLNNIRTALLNLGLAV